MKKSIFLVLFATSIIFTLNAQKTGYVNRDSVFSSMPETKAAEVILNNLLSQLQTELQSMQKEYQMKIQTFNAKSDSLSDVVKANKVKEIQDLEKRITDFQTQAQNEYALKQNELVKPIQDKFDKALEKVRKSGGFNVILNIDQNTLYVDPKFDITGDLLKELGISK